MLHCLCAPPVRFPSIFVLSLGNRNSRILKVATNSVATLILLLLRGRSSPWRMGGSVVAIRWLGKVPAWGQVAMQLIIHGATCPQALENCSASLTVSHTSPSTTTTDPG